MTPKPPSPEDNPVFMQAIRRALSIPASQVPKPGKGTKKAKPKGHATPKRAPVRKGK